MVTKLVKNKLTRRLILEDRIHQFEFIVYTGPGQKEALVEFLDLYRLPKEDLTFADVSDVTGGTFTHHGRYKMGLFWFPVHKPKAPVVAHEILHAVLWVQSRLGATILTPDDEHSCYYMEWLTRELGRVLWV